MRLIAILGCVVLVACHAEVKPSEPAPAARVTPVVVEPPAVTFDRLARDAFNARAQELFLPVFWRADANANRTIDPDELVVLWGPWAVSRADFVVNGAFTQRFELLYASLLTPDTDSGLSEDEARRHVLLKTELSQGKPTLVETSAASLSAEENAVLKELSQAALLVEQLYAQQHALSALQPQVAASDSMSKAVFHRNQSPFCVAPKTEQNAACSAVPERPARLSGLYPAELQADPKFCARLEKEKNKADLMGHFSTVVAEKDGFRAVPYNVAYQPLMEQVAARLEAAAGLITDAQEAAFKAYLLADAKAFRTNDWELANAAWVAMSATNSKWYVRAAPDEVYHEPCSWKAGFAFQLARINPESLVWQKRLEPVKKDMEKQLATLAGAPYKARDVKFKLPDFIDVVLNSGDQRNPHGATIGQSLPNWGKVAEKGGRTVVMTNLYTDADSRQALQAQMASLFCKDTLALGTTDPKPALMSVVLHEAAHNLGPAHDYAVKGKKAADLFGGPLASTMEELKAQTSALYFTWWLVEKKIVSEEEATQSSVRDLAWAFGHISRGMYDAGGGPKHYSQLASIELGSALRAGALVWKGAETAGNGSDVGCFELDLPRWKSHVVALEQRVLQAKAKGDRADAERMKADFVDDTGEWSKLRQTIAERWLRAPKATFVYAW